MGIKANLNSVELGRINKLELSLATINISSENMKPSEIQHKYNHQNKINLIILTLINRDGVGGNNPPPSLDNLDFSVTERLVDPRPVCKLKFVHCGPVEKNQSALSVSV